MWVEFAHQSKLLHICTSCEIEIKSSFFKQVHPAQSAACREAESGAGDALDAAGHA